MLDDVAKKISRNIISLNENLAVLIKSGNIPIFIDYTMLTSIILIREVGVYINDRGISLRDFIEGIWLDILNRENVPNFVTKNPSKYPLGKQNIRNLKKKEAPLQENSSINWLLTKEPYVFSSAGRYNKQYSYKKVYNYTTYMQIL